MDLTEEEHRRWGQCTVAELKGAMVKLGITIPATDNSKRELIGALVKFERKTAVMDLTEEEHRRWGQCTVAELKGAMVKLGITIPATDNSKRELIGALVKFERKTADFSACGEDEIQLLETGHGESDEEVDFVEINSGDEGGREEDLIGGMLKEEDIKTEDEEEEDDGTEAGSVRGTGRETPEPFQPSQDILEEDFPQKEELVEALKEGSGGYQLIIELSGVEVLANPKLQEVISTAAASHIKLSSNQIGVAVLQYATTARKEWAENEINENLIDGIKLLNCEPADIAKEFGIKFLDPLQLDGEVDDIVKKVIYLPDVPATCTENDLYEYFSYEALMIVMARYEGSCIGVVVCKDQDNVEDHVGQLCADIGIGGGVVIAAYNFDGYYAALKEKEKEEQDYYTKVSTEKSLEPEKVTPEIRCALNRTLQALRKESNEAAYKRRMFGQEHVELHRKVQMLENVIDRHTEVLLDKGEVPPEKEDFEMTTKYQRIGAYKKVAQPDPKVQRQNRLRRLKKLDYLVAFEKYRRKSGIGIHYNTKQDRRHDDTLLIREIKRAGVKPSDVEPVYLPPKEALEQAKEEGMIGCVNSTRGGQGKIILMSPKGSTNKMRPESKHPKGVAGLLFDGEVDVKSTTVHPERNFNQATTKRYQITRNFDNRHENRSVRQIPGQDWNLKRKSIKEANPFYQSGSPPKRQLCDRRPMQQQNQPGTTRPRFQAKGRGRGWSKPRDQSGFSQQIATRDQSGFSQQRGRRNQSGFSQQRAPGNQSSFSQQRATGDQSGFFQQRKVFFGNSETDYSAGGQFSTDSWQDPQGRIQAQQRHKSPRIAAQFSFEEAGRGDHSQGAGNYRQPLLPTPGHGKNPPARLRNQPPQPWFASTDIRQAPRNF